MGRVAYTRDDIDNAFNALPLAKGDVVFIHSNVGYFGRLRGAKSANDICAAIFASLQECIGSEGTIVVPTFTYTFSSEKIFDVDATSSKMGAFSEWVRKHPEAVRSADPFYSVAAIGRISEQMVQNISENSFGEDSFFARFYALKGKVLNLNFDGGSTFVHYVERQLNVPYRFDKKFSGTIRQSGVEREAKSTIWVRYLSDDALEAAFEPFDRLARQTGKYVTVSLGRGTIGIISAEDIFSLIQETLPHRPYLLTKAEELGVENPKIIVE